MVLIGAFASKVVPHIRLHEDGFVTHHTLCTENSVPRTRAEGQVVSADTTLRCTRYVDLVEVFLQPAGIARRHFEPGGQVDDRTEIRFVKMGIGFLPSGWGL